MMTTLITTLAINAPILACWSLQLLTTQVLVIQMFWVAAWMLLAGWMNEDGDLY